MDFNNELIKITASFPNSFKKVYLFNHYSKVNDLINEILNDETIFKPKEKEICILYSGKILNPNENFINIEKMNEFTVTILFKLKKMDNLLTIDLEPRGFDRLRRMDFNPQQIEEIRSQFHTIRGTLNESEEQKIEEEDEWFPVIFNSENPLESFQNFLPNNNIPIRNYEIRPLEVSNKWTTFSIGIILGLIFGPFSFLFLLISLQDRFGLIGLIFGIILHYFFKDSLNFFV